MRAARIISQHTFPYFVPSLQILPLDTGSQPEIEFQFRQRTTWAVQGGAGWENMPQIQKANSLKRVQFYPTTEYKPWAIGTGRATIE
jgi:hypothetical protein